MIITSDPIAELNKLAKWKQNQDMAIMAAMRDLGLSDEAIGEFLK